jgi:hypothetical protein
MGGVVGDLKKLRLERRWMIYKAEQSWKVILGETEAHCGGVTLLLIVGVGFPAFTLRYAFRHVVITKFYKLKGTVVRLFLNW